MAIINFPSSPANNEIFNVRDKVYKYNGVKNKWVAIAGLTDFQAVTFVTNTAFQSALANTNSAIAESTGGSEIYANSSLLPLVGLTAGSFAFSNNNNTLYLTNGSGWYKIALINQAPSITANLSNVTLGADGNTALISYTVSEPEGTPVTVSFANSGLANTSQGNVVLYTSNNTIQINNFAAEGDEWSANVILTVSDGVNLGTASISVEVAYSSSWDVDLSNVTYDSVSFYVGSQDGLPENSPGGLSFNSDGTKMFVVGASQFDVYQYSLSTGFDLSTASYDSVKFDVSSQEGSPLSLFLKPDGTKMYIVGAGSDAVYQYSLSTGFDLSTASYDSVSFSVLSQDTTPIGLFFTSDGTKMYMVGTASDAVYQYSLSTGFDLSTASYDSVSFDVSSQDGTPADIYFSPDGTKMYISGQTNKTIYQYSTGL